jgi:Phosphotransferase enzyme family
VSGGLEACLGPADQRGARELIEALDQYLGASSWQVLDAKELVPRVYRARLTGVGGERCLILKHLRSDWAQRDQLICRRMLPAAALEDHGPPLLAVAAESGGHRTWHVYDDAGDSSLAHDFTPERVEAVLRVVASVHVRLANHHLLAECRARFGDLGAHFFTTSVRDAIRGLEAIASAHIDGVDHAEVTGALLDEMYRLLGEERERVDIIHEAGGPETLLHGDLNLQNVLVREDNGGHHARLIDWDHTGVGYAAYDMSNFLAKLREPDRQTAFEAYHTLVQDAGLAPTSLKAWSRLSDTAHASRLANCVIWAAGDVLDGAHESGLDDLQMLERELRVLRGGGMVAR